MPTLSPDELQRRKRINKPILFITLVILLATCGTCIMSSDDDAGSQSNTTPHTEPEAPVTKWDAWITKYTSAWDGSCRPVEKIIKNALNDPDSYDHDATGYIPNEDTSLIVVTTRFRANNGFGAKMLAVYQATVDVNGNVIDIKELE